MEFLGGKIWEGNVLTPAGEEQEHLLKGSAGAVSVPRPFPCFNLPEERREGNKSAVGF